MDMENTLLAVAREFAPSGRGPLEMGSRLLQDFGFDSLRIMNLMLEIEKRFGVTIPNEELEPANFRTPETIVALLERILDNDGTET